VERWENVVRRCWVIGVGVCSTKCSVAAISAEETCVKEAENAGREVTGFPSSLW
jgi:hypothetical protein